MKEHRFVDAATLSGTRKTSAGYLIADAFAVRTGIQLYTGAQVGLADRDVVRVYRPEEEVTAPESLSTFSHAPITLGHPKEVTADNWKDLAKGEVSTEATWDGNKIKLPLIVKDAEAIRQIEAGTRELSAGYRCDIEFIDGVTSEGEAYDAIQRNIRINHLAIVERGRAGSECRIGDDAEPWGAAPITRSNQKEDQMSDALKTMVFGDKAAQVALADATIVESFLADQAKKLADAQADHDKAMAVKDADIEKLKAELDDAKGKILDDAALDKRVADRADLVATAKTIFPDIKPAGLSDAAIRKAAVAGALGDAVIADKADAYIEARFDILAGDAAQADPMADAMNSGVKTIQNDGWDAILNKKD